MLKRFTPLDGDYMRDYIDENVDLLWERQNDVYNWWTEQGYDEWREDYEYEYDNYFTYDWDMDEYYDENDNDMTWDWFQTRDYSKEDVINRVMDAFEDEYNAWGFERAGIDEAQLRQKIGEYYDNCRAYDEEIEEKKKPHWNAFSYYK